MNGNNLFDKKYYSSIGWLYAANYYGDPRNYSVTLYKALSGEGEP